MMGVKNQLFIMRESSSRSSFLTFKLDATSVPSGAWYIQGNDAVLAQRAGVGGFQKRGKFRVAGFETRPLVPKLQ